jgi:diguanylate cyclase (GGDEF)-like protein/PAS domain S-box-containing protein
MSARAGHPSVLVWSVATGVAYFVLGCIGLQLLDGYTAAAVIWPAAGLAVGALIVAGRRAWPGLALAVLAANFLTQVVVRKASFSLAAEISVIGLVQTLIAATVMSAIAGPRPHIGSLRTVGGLFAASTIAGLLAATLAASSLSMHLGFPFDRSLIGWWLGNAIGMLTLVPVILAMACPREDGAASRAEADGLIALTGIVAAFLFIRAPDSGLAVLSFGYPVVPFLLWCAIRAGARAATLGSLLLAAIAATATVHDRGPFASAAYGVHERAQMLQGFLAVVVLTTLVVGAVVADQRRARALASEEQQRLAEALTALHRVQSDLQTVFERAPIGHAIVGSDGALRSTNQALTAITGYDADALRDLGYDIVRAEDRHVMQELLASVRENGVPSNEAELAIVHRDGQLVDIAVFAAALHGENGGPDRTLLQILDLSRRKQLEAQLRELADRDPLTGLLNRRGFDRELALRLADARRYGADGALIMVDLDDFKRINDTDGHHAGDAVLVGMAVLLRRRLRATDIVGRLGGDEFAILLPHADRDAAENAALAVLEAAREESAVTVSLGVALIDPALTPHQLLIEADRALYAAKAAGRNGHAFSAAVTSRSAAQSGSAFGV